MKGILRVFFLFMAVLAAAHFIYWKDYWKPNAFFWDENYHIASAAKYLKGVFFMEPHPPLGKMFLALGEKFVNINDGEIYSYDKFDIIPHKLINPSFSFAGYRFFPSIFAVFNVILFSGIALWLTGSVLITAAATCLPLFDTALILQSRGAMLDSFLIFGVLVTVLAFLFLVRLPATEKKQIYSASFLMSFGLFFASMTKIFGYALLVLWVVIFLQRIDLRKRFYRIFPLNFLMVFILSLGVWIAHIQNGKIIEPSLMLRGDYMISSAYEKWLLGLEKDSWTHLPRKLYENLRYIFFFEENVPALDHDEAVVTGSYPIGWPFGSRPISYRWEKEEGNLHRYLYLIPNPWTWLMGLVGIALSIALWIRRGKKLIAQRPEIPALVVLYFCFFIPMCFITRVLYLYHYLPMLLISWVLFVLLLDEAKKALRGMWHRRFEMALCLIPLLCFHGYFAFRNFVNFTAVDCHTLADKDVFPFWGLKFPSCRDEAARRQFLKQFPVH